jgi:hypothetical protein
MIIQLVLWSSQSTDPFGNQLQSQLSVHVFVSSSANDQENSQERYEQRTMTFL